MKHDLLEQPTKTSLRLTTNEKQNVYASKKFNDEEQKKLLTFNHNRALKREINLKDPELRNKGIRKKKNVEIVYDKTQDKNETKESKENKEENPERRVIENI